MDSMTLIAIVILLAVCVIGIYIKMMLSKILKNMDGIVGVIKMDEKGNQVLHVSSDEARKFGR